MNSEFFASRVPGGQKIMAFGVLGIALCIMVCSGVFWGCYLYFIQKTFDRNPEEWAQFPDGCHSWWNKQWIVVIFSMGAGFDKTVSKISQTAMLIMMVWSMFVVSGDKIDELSASPTPAMQEVLTAWSWACWVPISLCICSCCLVCCVVLLAASQGSRSEGGSSTIESQLVDQKEDKEDTFQQV